MITGQCYVPLFNTVGNRAHVNAGCCLVPLSIENDKNDSSLASLIKIRIPHF